MALLFELLLGALQIVTLVLIELVRVEPEVGARPLRNLGLDPAATVMIGPKERRREP